MIKSLFRISVSVGLLGMAFGIFMGITLDFVLAPVHAHLNLLGFVTMFLSALYYRAFPIAASSRLARYQAVVSVVGAIVFPAGIAGVLLGGHDRFEPVGCRRGHCLRRHGAVRGDRLPHRRIRAALGRADEVIPAVAPASVGAHTALCSRWSKVADTFRNNKVWWPLRSQGDKLFVARNPR
jgi:hypothetical protein